MVTENNGALKKFGSDFEVALPQLDSLSKSEPIKKWWISDYFDRQGITDGNSLFTYLNNEGGAFGVLANPYLIYQVKRRELFGVYNRNEIIGNEYFCSLCKETIVNKRQRFYMIVDTFEKVILNGYNSHGRRINDNDIFIKRDKIEEFMNDIIERHKKICKHINAPVAQ